MRRRLIVRLGGAALLAAASVVLLLQVHVGGPGKAGRSCGSPLDVVVDRAGWETWYAQDSVDRVAADPLLRTLRCPHAVNTRTAVAGVLAAVGLVAIGLTRPARRRGDGPVTAQGLARLGRGVSVLGAALWIGGLAALAVLLADRHAALFTFVTRPTILALGFVALTPVLALVAGGRALVIVARHLEEPADRPVNEPADEPADRPVNEPVNEPGRGREAE